MAQHPPASALSLETVRAHIRSLYETAPSIRISVAIAHSKVVQDAEVTIIGVYPHVFCVEEVVAGVKQRHTFQYADVITRRVAVPGLD